MKIYQIVDTIRHSVKAQMPDHNYSFNDQFIYTSFLSEVFALTTEANTLQSASNSMNWITICIPLQLEDGVCKSCPKKTSMPLPAIYSLGLGMGIKVFTAAGELMSNVDQEEMKYKSLDSIYNNYQKYTIINKKIAVYNQLQDSVIVKVLVTDPVGAAQLISDVTNEAAASCVNNMDLEFPGNQEIIGRAIKNAIRTMLYTKRIPADVKPHNENQ